MCLTLGVNPLIMRVMNLREKQKTAFYIALGRTISRLRLETKKSQEELAKKVGISRTTLINIENGSQSVSLHVAIAISQVLRCDLMSMLPSKEEYEKVDIAGGLPPEAAGVVEEVINKGTL